MDKVELKHKIIPGGEKEGEKNTDNKIICGLFGNRKNRI